MPIHYFQELYTTHPMFCGWVLSSLATLLVTTMPSPTDKSSPWYQWVFNIAHAVQLLIPRLVAQYKSESK